MGVRVRWVVTGVVLARAAIKAAKFGPKIGIGSTVTLVVPRIGGSMLSAVRRAIGSSRQNVGSSWGGGVNVTGM